MFDFKDFRKNKGWSQGHAAKHVFGLSAPVWAKLEQGQKPEQQLKIYGKACQLFDQGIDLSVQPTPKQMKSASILHQKKYVELSFLLGHGNNCWSNLASGNLPWTKRWCVIVNTVLHTLGNPEPNNHSEIEVAGSELTQPEVTVVSVIEPESFEHVQPVIIDGEPLWIVADVCRAIEHSNSRAAINLARKDDVRKVTSPDYMGRMVEQWAVNEFGLLRILAKSSVPKAEPFERWVFEEVLPNIRKTGCYTKNQNVVDLPTWAAALFQQMGGNVFQLQQTIQAQNKQIEERLAAVEAQATPEAVINKLQELDSLKTELHELIHEIVRAANTFPATDPIAGDFQNYQTVWRKVFKAASPPVSKKAEYRTEEQIQPSIETARIILHRLTSGLPSVPPATPQQLSIKEVA